MSKILGLLSLLLCCAVSCPSGFALDASAVEFKSDKTAGASSSDGGDNLSVEVKADGKTTAHATLPTTDEEGWYVLTGEYRTSGMDPMGMFVLSITQLDPLPWVGITASSDWSPFQVCFYVKEPGLKRDLNVVLDAEQMRVTAKGKVELRKVEIAPYKLPANKELLRNGDFSKGKVGELPALWNWSYHGRPGDYALVEDKTFQLGTKTLQVISENKEDGRTIVAHGLPMPTGGSLVFTAWVRSDDPGMTVGLYLVNAGYKWLKVINAPITEKWTKVTLEVDVPTDQDGTFISPRIDVRGNGTARVAGASLLWHDSAVVAATDPVAPAAAAAAPSTGKNLIANPDMDLGFNDWSVDYYEGASTEMLKNQIEGEPMRVVAGEGVDGGNAMLVPPGTCLVSSTVPITPGKKYSVSIYLKATKPDDTVTLRFVDAGWHMYSFTCQDIPTDHWKRYSMTNLWDKPSMQKRAYMRIDSENGTVLMDRAQVEEGDLTDFAAPPVMIGVLAKEQVFAPGQEITGLNAQVIVAEGAQGPAKVEVDVKDAWGQSVGHQELLPTGEPSIPLAGLPSDKLGVFVIDLKAVDADGKAVAQAQSRYAVIDKPAPAMLSTGFPLFGVGAEPIRIPLWNMAQDLSLYERMGARFARFFLAADRMTDPVYQDLFREQIKPFAEHGITTTIGNLGLPKDLRKIVQEQDKLTPETLKAWADFVKAAVTPYKDQLHYWEVINEPNIGAGKEKLSPEKYSALLHTAYDTIKSVDPSLQVVGFALATADFDFVRSCMKLGAGKWMDVFTWHPYREAPDVPDVFSELNKMKVLLKEGGFQGATINGEQYFSTNIPLFHNHDEEVKRRYILPASEEMWTTGRIMQTFVHHAAAEVPWSIFAPGLNVLKLGGIDEHFIYYVYGAYNAATRMFNNAGPGQPVPFNDDARAFFFPRAEGGPLLALYTLLPEFNGHMKLSQEGIVAYDMMGNKIAPETLQADGLPMQVSPVYVRFPEGTTLAQIQTSLGQADISGLGEPFHMKMTVLADGHLGVVVTNRMNKSVSGQLNIRDYPATWKFESESADFGPLAGGASVVVPLGGVTPLADLGDYKATLSAAAQDKFTRQEVRFAPLMASQTLNARIGGPLTQWTNWLSLGEANLSKKGPNSPPHTGPADLSARLALGWDAQGLTVALVVTDDVAAFPHADKMGDFTFDSLQIYFDQKNNAESPTQQADSDDVSYHISLTDGKPVAYLEKGVEGRYLGAANQSTGVDPDVQTSIVRQGNQTIYQMRFPPKCLPSVAFTPGGTLGFSLLINDNDGKGRKEGLTLAPKGEDPWNKPFYFRTLIFRGAGK